MPKFVNNLIKHGKRNYLMKLKGEKIWGNHHIIEQVV